MNIDLTINTAVAETILTGFIRSESWWNGRIGLSGGLDSAISLRRPPGSGECIRHPAAVQVIPPDRGAAPLLMTGSACEQHHRHRRHGGRIWWDRLSKRGQHRNAADGCAL
jgi:hypothetical protein